MRERDSGRLRRLANLWFGFSARVDRRTYALTGFSLMALKYAVDASAIKLATGEIWTPFSYLSPLWTTRDALAKQQEGWITWTLLVWTLPFVWIGASMTARRARDAGVGLSWALLFFVPIVNYLWMLILCALPTAHSADAPVGETGVAVGSLGWGVRAAAFAAALGFALCVISVVLLKSYGAMLFVGTPFAMGFATAVYRRPRGVRPWEAIVSAQMAVLLTGGALLLFALEGVICLGMAWPIAALLALFGALVGEGVGRTHALSPSQSALLLLALPLLLGAESAGSRAPVREVMTHVEIDAPPEAVWRHVIGFSELPPPSEFVFRSGIAYPKRARLEGSGVGAVRYCEFSTGPFVEPITVWNPPRRLSFDVAEQPEPMHETSPYRRVHAAHLVDGLLSRRGEFRLEKLPGGRTRLEGSTWYSVEMWPQPYWTLFSDALIHRIHARVLAHVKQLSEH